MEISTIIYLIGKLTPMAISAINYKLEKKHRKNIEGKFLELQQEMNEFSKNLQIINSKLDQLTNWSINQLSQRSIIIFQILHEMALTQSVSLFEKQLDLIYTHSLFLITLDEDNTLFDTKEKRLQIKNLHCVGYWGLYIFFLYHNEEKCINDAVYSCLSKHPLLGGIIFPKAYFEQEVPVFCEIIDSMKNGISFNDVNVTEIDLLKQYQDLPSNIAAPLLEIHLEEEIERLQSFAEKQLKKMSHE